MKHILQQELVWLWNVLRDFGKSHQPMYTTETPVMNELASA